MWRRKYFAANATSSDIQLYIANLLGLRVFMLLPIKAYLSSLNSSRVMRMAVMLEPCLFYMKHEEAADCGYGDGVTMQILVKARNLLKRTTTKQKRWFIRESMLIYTNPRFPALSDSPSLFPIRIVCFRVLLFASELQCLLPCHDSTTSYLDRWFWDPSWTTLRLHLSFCENLFKHFDIRSGSSTFLTSFCKFRLFFLIFASEYRSRTKLQPVL